MSEVGTFDFDIMPPEERRRLQLARDFTIALIRTRAPDTDDMVGYVETALDAADHLLKRLKDPRP